MYETIVLDRMEHIAILKINRPKALNAINQKVVEEMNAALEEIGRDPSVKVLVITGEGDKAFVAGADIAYMATLNPIQARAFSRAGQELLFKIESLPIPVIACVNGYALGGGTELAMACDFIYAAETAR
ncbi:MAG: enoyl-CoA hydratase/isomerase family protein, partial [Desulfatiglandales bacterium]